MPRTDQALAWGNATPDLWRTLPAVNLNSFRPTSAQAKAAAAAPTWAPGERHDAMRDAVFKAALKDDLDAANAANQKAIASGLPQAEADNTAKDAWAAGKQAALEKHAKAKAPSDLASKWARRCPPIDAESLEYLGGITLFFEVLKLINKYVHLTNEATVAVGLYIFFTYLQHRMPKLRYAPLLHITAGGMECGKSLLGEVICGLAHRQLYTTGDLTGPVIFRTVEKYKPTLVIDEADVFMGKNAKGEKAEILKGLINGSVIKESACVPRLVGEKHDAKL